MIGQLHQGNLHLTPKLAYVVAVTVTGGLLGAYYGSQKFNTPTLKYVLTTGLLIVCLKLMFV